MIDKWINTDRSLATAGHANIVARLLDNNANIEAQSERTKDTALSLACSGGRQEVVEVLLKKGANREHRNVSDYTGTTNDFNRSLTNKSLSIVVNLFSSQSCCIRWICEYYSIVTQSWCRNQFEVKLHQYLDILIVTFHLLSSILELVAN